MNMKKTLIALGLAAGMGLASGHGAGAVPANAIAVKDAAAAASPVEQAQYYERHTRHGIVKCYRTLVIGPYRCRYFRSPI
jgi:hypothetical protein